MEDKQYFTPNIDDLRLGYKFELYIHDNWESVTFSQFDIMCYEQFTTCLEKKEVRTPYLTKEQIEAEGWKFIGNGNCGGVMHGFEKSDFELSLWDVFCPAHIEITDCEGNIKFDGECKSINEFRYICKLLKIN